MADLTNNFDGIDTNAYDDVCIIHQNQVICVKGNKPENCSFSSVPVSFVLAVRYNSGKPYYSVFQMQYDKFIFIGGGERITLGSYLFRGRITHCGCENRNCSSAFKDMTGQKNR